MELPIDLFGASYWCQQLLLLLYRYPVGRPTADCMLAVVADQIDFVVMLFWCIEWLLDVVSGSLGS